MHKNFSKASECVIYACCGSKCKKKGGKLLYKKLKSEVKNKQLKRQIQIIKTGCTDRCKAGPILAVMPANKWHLQVTENEALKILEHCEESLNLR